MTKDITNEQFEITRFRRHLLPTQGRPLVDDLRHLRLPESHDRARKTPTPALQSDVSAGI